MVSVSFSAFDPFPDPVRRSDSADEFRIFHVGLEKTDDSFDTNRLSSAPSGPGRPMTPSELTARFEQVMDMRSSEQRERLQQVFAFLESDRALSRLDISELNGLIERLDFHTLSSGHKIVLLTLASLVRFVEEKTLVLVDEPESHLHPPLLAAFTRALSWLMTDRNGIAIVATHSPVVLQEVPRNCAWVVSSSGEEAWIDRPSIETFGENLGVLTRDVFRLEITKSGYNQLLEDVASRFPTYEAALAELDGHLGDEAKSRLRSIIARGDGGWAS